MRLSKHRGARRRIFAGALAAAAGSALVGQRVARHAREPKGLSDEVALITGASRGLGFLLARELGRRGCSLVICARDSRQLDRTASELRQHAPDILAVCCDVGQRDEIQRMVRQATERFGRIDVLVNNAGLMQVAPLAAMTEDDFRTAMDAMFWGVLNSTLEVLPGMLERRSGRIVDITSIGGVVSVPHLLPYAAAKFAAVGFSEGLRAELAGTGVQVTTVVPGLMRTGSHLNAHFKGNHEREFGWFSLGASLPLLSMDAERAARLIVDAVERGDTKLTLTLAANVLERAHGAGSGAVSGVLGLVNRLLLPTADRPNEPLLGREIQARMGAGVLDWLTTLGTASARKFHQLDESR